MAEEVSNTITKREELEEIQDKVWNVVRQFEAEDRYYRERRIRLWRKLDLYWHGIQYIYWSDAIEDYRHPGYPGGLTDNEEQEFDFFYNKVINIYKAHGQSIISALSANVPALVFYPEDAEVSSDVATARAYTKLAELTKKRTKFNYIFIKAIFLIWNEDFVAAHNYSVDTDKTAKVPIYEDVDHTRQGYSCPACEAEVDEDTQVCPECQQRITPEPTEINETINEQVDWKEVTKQGQKIDVYGPTHVKISSYAEDLEGASYLILSYDQHVSVLKDKYPKFRDKIKMEETEETYEKWARRPFNDYDDTNNLATVKVAWLRPHAFEELDEEEAKEMKKKFPTGARAIFINETLVEISEERMDDHWTISRSPTSKYIHADPLGEPLADIQELKNDLTNLTSQTIEYGIPETYVDPQVVDLDAYKGRVSRPGQITPAKPIAGQPLPQSFYETKPSTLSREVNLFTNSLEQDGQFATGALPSIFGGGLQSGSSRTAAEYAQSKNMALQRLSIHYEMMVRFTVELFEKVVKSYAASMVEDERIPEMQGDGFTNTFIRVSDLEGNVGRVDAEGSEQFPNTWMQKRDTVLELLQLNSEYLNNVIFHPNNTSVLRNTLGLYDLYVPGEDSRNKQWAEIEELINSEPVMDDQGQLIPTVQTMDSDEHEVEGEICRLFLNGERGRELRNARPEAFLNVLLHMKSHKSSSIQEQQGREQMEADAQAEEESRQQVT